MRYIIFTFLLTLIPGLFQQVGAQGFSSFNNRNHPEINWQVAETEHFKIMYPAHLAGIEQKAASIAEASYKALSQNLDVTFDKKVRIYLTDEDEILNGFALTPFGYTNIWVHVNDVATSWTGNTKWLRTVLSHELAHLFHGRAISSKFRLLSYFLGDPIPSFWAEGFAQYETELWDAYRGDQWLRTAVLDDRLSFEDGRSIWNGRLLYASGNGQLRYLAEQYGDSTLTQILKHRKRSAFGLIEHHDFYTAFKKVTGKSYRSFYDEWRRHVNIYYNTLAGQMENTDSLSVDPLKLPGQYLYNIQYSPDTTKAAVLALTSISRPVRRLFVLDKEKNTAKLVADGGINTPVNWSPDGKQLAFSRRTRAKNGSIINDLFVVSENGGKAKQITKNRRAISPAFSPDGTHMAFIGSHRGTANVFLLDLNGGTETALTSFTGDVQLAALDWHTASNKIVVGRFGEDGARDVFVLDPGTLAIQVLTEKGVDDQFPIWSPDGSQVAITSMQDRVPNVFIIDVESETDSTNNRRRITNLITGARAHDWVQPDSLHPAGTLVVSTHSSKLRDEVYRIDAGRTPYEPAIQIPAGYGDWVTHRPPNEVPAVIPPADSTTITYRGKYRSLKNLVHLFSFGLPFYNNEDDWGISGITSWTEPLGHHTIGITTAISFPSFKENSFLLGSYTNRQLKPTITINGFTDLPTPTAYGNRYLVSAYTGGTLALNWPLDVWVRPYTGTQFNLKLSYFQSDPFDDDAFQGDNLPAGLQSPIKGELATVEARITRKSQRPYALNIIHPLDGYGISAKLEVGSKVLGADASYLEGDVAVYGILPALSLHRIFLYGRGIIQNGSSFPQYQPGFARFDDLQVVAPQFGLLAFSDAVRVRGYREFAYGDKLLFGSAEYRMPFIPSLRTTLLGLVSLGSTTLTGFVDAGIVWNNSNQVTERAGAGVEAKNVITIGGMLQIMHAVGIAQPVNNLGTSDNYEVYYRVRASLPF